MTAVLNDIFAANDRIMSSVLCLEKIADSIFGARPVEPGADVKNPEPYTMAHKLEAALSIQSQWISRLSEVQLRLNRI